MSATEPTPAETTPPETTTPAEATTAAAPPPPPPGPRRLVRPRNDTRIGGVCGGVARYANVDATLVRVLSVVAAFFLFPFPVLAYVLLWAIIPAE